MPTKNKMPTKQKIQYINTKDYSKEELDALHEYFKSIRLTQYLPNRRTSTKTIATFEKYSSDHYSYVSEEELDSRYEEYVSNFKLIVSDVSNITAKNEVPPTRLWIALDSITSKDLLEIEELLHTREFVRVTADTEITFLDYKNIWINEDRKIWGFTDIAPEEDCNKPIHIDALKRTYSNTTTLVAGGLVSLLLRDLWNIFWKNTLDAEKKKNVEFGDIIKILNGDL